MRLFYHAGTARNHRTGMPAMPETATDVARIDMQDTSVNDTPRHRLCLQ